MPNNTENVLRVTGPEADLAAFETVCRGRSPEYAPSGHKFEDEAENPECCLTFSGICPPPAEVTAQKYDPAGYEWQSANWGTKWDAYGPPQSCRLGNALIYTFETAWRPPAPWLRAASAQFPTLRFELFARDEYPYTVSILAYHYDGEQTWEECYGEEKREKVGAA